MKVETTFAMYGGTFWPDDILDELDGTITRVSNKTLFFEKVDEHLMVRFNFNEDNIIPLGMYINIAIEAETTEDSSRVVSIGKIKGFTFTKVHAEKDAIPIREVK